MAFPPRTNAKVSKDKPSPEMRTGIEDGYQVSSEGRGKWLHSKSLADNFPWEEEGTAGNGLM